MYSVYRECCKVHDVGDLRLRIVSEAVVDLIADMRTLVTNKPSPDQHVKNISVLCREHYQSFCQKWQNNFGIILRRRISTVFATILRWFRFPIICNFRETLEQSIISWCCCILVVTRVSSPNNLLPASFSSEHWLLLIS